MKTNYFIKQLIGAILFFTVIFVSAGRIDYWPGLIYVAIGLVMMALGYTVFRIDPELASERSNPGEGPLGWDKAILGLSFLGTLAMFVTGGLDSGRFHWSPCMPSFVTVIGALMTAGGQMLFLIAQNQNRFFSSVVRIQSDRGHTVCDTGLYRVVRHPAYLGSIIQTMGFPLLFASLWSIIPAAFLAAVLIARTILEDRLLMKDLAGYISYAQKTGYRLIPFIW